MSLRRESKFRPASSAASQWAQGKFSAVPQALAACEIRTIAQRSSQTQGSRLRVIFYFVQTHNMSSSLKESDLKSDVADIADIAVSLQAFAW